MKSADDKTWKIFNVQSMKKVLGLVIKWKMYYYPELDVLNGKVGGQNLEYFQISNQ